MIWRLLNIILILLDSILITIFYESVFERRLGNNSIPFLTITVLFVINMSAFTHLNFVPRFLLVTIGLLFVSFALYSGSFLGLTGAGLFVQALFFAMTLLHNIAVKALYPSLSISLSDEPDNIAVLGLLCTRIVLFSVVYAVHSRTDIKVIRNKRTALFIVCPLLVWSSVLLFSASGSNGLNHSFLFLAATVLSTISMLVLVWWIITLSNETNRIALAEREKERNEMENQFLRQELQSMEELKEWRHDISDHLSVLLGLANEDKNTKIKDYIQDMKNYIGRLNEPFSGNTPVDMLITQMVRTAEKSGIKCSVKLCLPEDDGFDIVRLCNIIANIWKNAIDACNELPSDMMRYILFTCICQKEGLHVRCINSSPDHTKTGIRTTKTDGEHGLGTRSIINNAEQLGGTCSFKPFVDRFEVEVIIPGIAIAQTKQTISVYRTQS